MSVTSPAVKGLEWHPVPEGYAGPDLHAVLASRLPADLLGVVYGYMVGPDPDTDARAVAHGLPQLVQDPNAALANACLGGHEDLARLMLDRGATDYNIGLAKACQGGHEALARLMLEKGATDYDRGLDSACWGGHEALARLMLDRGATNYNQALFYARRYCQEGLVRLLLECQARASS